MSDLFGNPEDWFSHNEAHIFQIYIRCHVSGGQEKRVINHPDFTPVIDTLVERLDYPGSIKSKVLISLCCSTC